jgi:cation:H+ antiporter
MTILLLVAGLTTLLAGAEFLVKGAMKIAEAIGISPLVVGLTVVAIGTSSPEMAVSVMASATGQGNLALANVVGSNLVNILFILGISAIVVPLTVARQLIRFDVPVMIISSLLMLAFSFDGSFARWEGFVLLGLGCWYSVLLIRMSRQESKQQMVEGYLEDGRMPAKKTGILLSVFFVIAGLGMLVLGSRWLVSSATDIARILGIGEVVIGLTVVAAGTSLPEVATSAMAAFRGERDIAVGNVVGSSIFNLLFILGTSVAVSEASIPVSEQLMQFDIPVMTAVAVACLPMFFTGRTIDRWEGVVFLGYYIAYTVFIVLANLRHSSLELFAATMAWFVIPLTVLTLAVSVAGEIKKKK